MRIGRLRHRVAIDRKQRTPDGGGGYTEEWVAHATKWAEVRPMRGEEREHAEAVRSGGDYKIMMRNPVDIAEDDRIVWHGETYNVRFVPRVGAHPMYIEIDAELGIKS